jgi:NADH:ubiquinone oxidoreductase subunit
MPAIYDDAAAIKSVFSGSFRICPQNPVDSFVASSRWTARKSSPIPVRMSSTSTYSRPSLRQLGGLKGLFRNPGLVLWTLRSGGAVGEDSFGNRYFQQRAFAKGTKPRRWVVYAGGATDASVIGPEWHAWLHYTTDEVLPTGGAKPWQKAHQPNLTGTASSYRPAGHDYEGGKRAKASGDYQSWTPDL